VSGTLFLVPTPIGNPADLSPRAREVLSAVDRIAAEDTRDARRLLRTAGLGRLPPLVSYHDHNELQRSRTLVARLLAGEDVALVSDAGTPLVADPGYRLVRAALDSGIDVVALPGPCAAVVALSGAGLACDEVLFGGFLPRDAGARRAAIEARRYETATLVFYEAPHRVRDTLGSLLDVWGDRRAALARSLTKPHEQWLRGTLGSILAALEEEVSGEITLVVEGATGERPSDDRVDALVDGLVAAGVHVGVVRDVVARIYDRPRREIYQKALAARPPSSAGESEP
jgi:16S rRNA (cytidine1402-2'-O)-methyltransferase